MGKWGVLLDNSRSVSSPDAASVEEDGFPLDPGDGSTVYWAHSVFANSYAGRTTMTCLYSCQLVATTRTVSKVQPR